jgi:cytochrome c oxidase assembly protein subunit 15
LILLAWSLVLGVLAQIVIGGIVVLTGLNPYANMAHFLVSMVLVACALLLYRRAAVSPSDRWWRRIPHQLIRLHGALMALACIAVTTGTVVTATGPHAGDEDAVRFGFELVSVVRIHSVSVIATVALLVILLIKSRRISQDGYREALSAFAFVAVCQGAIGYLQYFTGVPVVLVGAHIAGAVSFLIAILNTAYVPLPNNIGVE